MTVRALRNLLAEIDRQGGPEAARQGRLHLPDKAPTERTPQPMATAPAPRPAPPAPLTTAADVRLKTAPGFEPEGLSVGQLLKWGDEHPDAEVRDQAARGRAILTGLRRRHAADAELTALALEREQLQKRLAELTARESELAPAKKTRKAVSYPAAEVRAWASANNIPCPAVGRVPKPVVDAWREATAPAGGAGS